MLFRSPLSILASFVKYKVSIGAWIYLWAFYFVPLIYISVFVPVPYCLDTQGASRVVPGKSGLHARGEGERVLALESREGTRASRRVEEAQR